MQRPVTAPYADDECERMVRPLMQAKQHLHGPPDGVEPRRFLGAAKARVDHGLSDPGHHMRDPGFTPSYHMI